MTDPHLIIFIKNPELGKVKTRLAADIGDEKALEAYIAMMLRTKEVIIDSGFQATVFYDQNIVQDDIWQHPSIHKSVQEGIDLGERIQNAFAEVFSVSGAAPVCIIGSDCFGLSKDHLKQAFQQLESNNMVIGPTFDGGYYLLGTTQYQPSLFQNIEWSTETVFDHSLRNAKSANLKWSILPKLRDIDYLEDLKAYPELVRMLGI